MGNLVLLWLAALPLMGSPGPATLSLAAIGAAFSARAGLPYLAGIILGTTTVLLLIAAGVTGLILASPAAVTVISLLAAAYILYLAYKIATAPVLGNALEKARPPAFLGGLALALANPKAYIAIGAVYAGNRIYEHDLGHDTLAKIVALTLVIILVNSVWLIFGAMLARFLHDPKIGRAVNILFAVLLVISVAFSVLS